MEKKFVSLAPLTPEQAIAAAMQVKLPKKKPTGNKKPKSPKKPKRN